MIDDAELKEFQEWKRAKNRSELDEAFHILESSLSNPAGRGYNCVMPAQAYRVLANAIIALKNRLINE